MKTTLQKPHQHTQPNQRFRTSGSIGIGIFTFILTVVFPFVGQAQNGNGQGNGNSNATNKLHPIGNVGVGTMSPTESLEVVGKTRLNGELQVYENTLMEKELRVKERTDFEKEVHTAGEAIFYHPTGIKLKQFEDVSLNYNRMVSLTPSGNFELINGIRFIPNCKLDITGNICVSGTATINNLDVPGRIKVGANSLYLGTSTTGTTPGTANYIKTTIGALRINGTETGITGAIQNTLINPDGGNVGIGTGTTAPSHNLHIKGIAPTLRIEDTTPLTGTTEPTNFKILAHNGAARLISDQSFLIFINGDNNENNRLFAVVDNGTSLGGNSKNLFMIEEGGSVSIGTSSPTARLDINGGTGDGDQDIKIRATNGTVNSELRMMAVVSSGVAESQIQFNGKLRFTEPVGGNVRLTISDNGDVDVCGRLLATKVQVASGWCDYVFEEEYPLMPLMDVEKYITENKHLPGITKAATVETDGLDLGAMSKAMMEKIEELYLYTLEQEKRIKALEKQVGEN